MYGQPDELPASAPDNKPSYVTIRCRWEVAIYALYAGELHASGGNGAENRHICSELISLWLGRVKNRSAVGAGKWKMQVAATYVHCCLRPPLISLEARLDCFFPARQREAVVIGPTRIGWELCVAG